MSKLYTDENLANNYKSYKALIASKYSGKNVTTVSAEKAKSNPNFFGKVPAFESSGVNLFESNAIAYYLSDARLRGENESAQSQVVNWLLYSNELWSVVFAWVLPAVGLSKEKQTMELAKAEVKNVLKSLNDYLLSRTYLVGERVTLADISMAITLLPLYQHVLEPTIRDQYLNVTRYFMTMVNQKQFIEVIGKVELCTNVKQISAGDGKKAESKKSEPKKQAQPKPPADDAGDDDLIPSQPEPKDPFKEFPKGKWDMDDFKRFYSNNEVEKSIPYFWEKFDKDHYSIWYCEYKYPEELTQVFMSCNLISGMFQRLDRMRKNAFASMILFGEDNNSTISGIWVWRGHQLAFPLSDDWTVDYESYDWKKLNPDDEKTKKLVKEYLAWEGDFDGKKFNQGKIFK